MIRYNIDPFRQYRGHAVEAAGLLPPMIECGLLESDGDLDKFWEAVGKCYPFLTNIKKADVDDHMVYHYPGDPDMYPLMIVEGEGLKVGIYPYGFVAVVKDGVAYSTRMD